MTHHVFHVRGVQEKKDLVHRLASGTGRRILFMRTKHQARKLAKQLTDSGVPSVDLHGNLSQPARERNLAAFASGEARVLVATDIAARGVHVDNVELVVHVDPPMEHKAYLHRSGRTARAGSDGDVVDRRASRAAQGHPAAPARAPASPCVRGRSRPTRLRCIASSARSRRCAPRLRKPCPGAPAGRGTIAAPISTVGGLRRGAPGGNRRRGSRGAGARTR